MEGLRTGVTRCGIMVAPSFVDYHEANCAGCLDKVVVQLRIALAEAQRERDAAKAENDRLESAVFALNVEEFENLVEQLRVVKAENEELRADRERMNWLLDLSKRTDVGIVTNTGGALVRYAGSRDELDRAIREARRGE